MKNVKLIISDIDGTVLTSEHQVTARLKEAVAKISAHLPFVLASARSPKGMLAIAEELELLEQPLACYNGALILKNGDLNQLTPLFSQPLVLNEVEEIVQLLEDFPTISLNLYSNADWYVPKMDRWAQIEGEITQIDPIQKELSSLFADDVPLHKLLLIGEVAEIQEVFAALNQLELENSAFYLSKDNYLEITHKAVSKEAALRELAAYYQVTLADTMAIGDNFNDLPMITLAGMGVAMSNAPSAVQEKADLITDSNDADGVAKILETLN